MGGPLAVFLVWLFVFLAPKVASWLRPVLLPNSFHVWFVVLGWSADGNELDCWTFLVINGCWSWGHIIKIWTAGLEIGPGSSCMHGVR